MACIVFRFQKNTLLLLQETNVFERDAHASPIVSIYIAAQLYISPIPSPINFMLYAQSESIGFTPFYLKDRNFVLDFV